MKIIVVSDSHGRDDLLYDLQLQYPQADAFLHCGDLENDMEFSNAFADKIAPSYLSDLYKAPFNQSLTLSDEELANLREACVSDSTRVIHYLDSVLKDKQDLMERQVKSLEHIAEQAYSQASSAHALSETF